MGVDVRFGTDGWRAVIADEFTTENVALVTQAVADWLNAATPARGGRPRVIVGYDTRFLSRRFAEVSASVLAANGFHVWLVDRPSPTPAVSWAIREHGLDGGIMITASHNPPEYNGLKLKAAYAGSALPEMTAEVEGIYRQNLARGRKPGCMELAEARRRGRLDDFDPRPGYLRQLARYADLRRITAARLPVVVDTMHGAGYGYLSELLREHGVAVSEVRADPRPDFGGTPPEPIARHLRPARAAVIAQAAAAGLCLDGDGDRVAAVDENGAVVDAHRVFALLLRHLFEQRGKRGSVVKTFAGSRMIDRLAGHYGLPFHETPIGFKHVCRFALQEQVLIGGEESGGIGVGDHIPERDGLLCNLLLLEAMAVRGRSLAQLVDELMSMVGPHYFERVDLRLPPAQKEALLERLHRDPPASLAGLRVEGVNSLDGVKLLFAEHGWILFRPSGTEPVVRIYVEADHPDRVRRLIDAGVAFARGVGPAPGVC